jgi:two-component system cell cycle response regulator
MEREPEWERDRAAILVVDDGEVNRDLAEACLTGAGYRVLLAADGVEGIRLARDRSPDVILLDIVMPGMSGLEVCRTLRADPLTVDIPVIFVSALDDPTDIIQGLEMGADGYITKPYNPREVVARVKASLRIKSLYDGLKRLNRQLAEKAITDGLTGLLNRSHMEVRGSEEFARAQRYALPLAVLLADVDHFKLVNDTFGHPQGDAVLRELSTVLRLSTRAVDVVGRYGGEEFIIILPQTDLAGARTLANRLRFAVETHRFPLLDPTRDRGFLTITISVGCRSAVGGQPGFPEGWPDMARDADEALYEAKRDGRNRVVCR